MSFLLDTNAISELRKSERLADPPFDLGHDPSAPSAKKLRGHPKGRRFSVMGGDIVNPLSSRATWSSSGFNL